MFCVPSWPGDSLWEGGVPYTQKKMTLSKLQFFGDIFYLVTITKKFHGGKKIEKATKNDYLTDTVVVRMEIKRNYCQCHRYLLL